MVLDELQYGANYAGLSAGIRAALEYLRDTDFTQVPDGRYPVGSAGVFTIVSRYRTRLPADAIWESHRKQIDVQYLASGRERFGYAPLSQAPPVKTPYSEEKDVILYQPGEEWLTLSAGQFAIFFPQDVHAPSLASGDPADVLKVVVKVPVG